MRPKSSLELKAEACRRASQIIQASQEGGPTEMQLAIRRIEQIPDYYTLEEARTLFEEFRFRYSAQLPNTRGKYPAPMAPIDPRQAEANAMRSSQLSCALCFITPSNPNQPSSI